MAPPPGAGFQLPSLSLPRILLQVPRPGGHNHQPDLSEFKLVVDRGLGHREDTEMGLAKHGRLLFSNQNTVAYCLAIKTR